MSSSKSLRTNILRLASASSWALLAASPSYAAEEPPETPSAQAGLEEVLVTARKRRESILNVPVTETVVRPQQLESFAVTEVVDLPKLVPGLIIGKSLLSNGATVAIRGVGTTTQDPGVDSSVTFNLDGLAMGQGLAFRSGTFDLAQIEVLKGPQALFYGKNSPGGVISLVTADPTDRPEISTRLAYEAEARTYRGELILSGPVTDTLGLRFAGMYSDSDGYFYARGVPGPGALAPPAGRLPAAKNTILRGTALWNPADRFSARLKVNYVRDELLTQEVGQQECGSVANPPMPPIQAQFIGDQADCRIDRYVRGVGMDPAVFPGIPNGGHPFNDTTQVFSTLELNYDVLPDLTLTSTTAYYDLDAENLVNTFQTTSAAPAFSADNVFERKDFTQEFRLDSNFLSPVNFTLGAFYQDAKLQHKLRFIGNSLFGFPADFTHRRTKLPIETISAFGQLRWSFRPGWELAGGARWTDETRKQSPFDLLTNLSVPVVTSKIQDSNVSPEATLTYKPSDNVTLFAAYKEGFKSGSFNIGTPTGSRLNNAFGPEEVQGYELGFKSYLLDRQLSLNVSGYFYDYEGLQVGAIQESADGFFVIRTLNSGSSETYGIDLDAQFRPIAVDGLSLNLSVNWNQAEYKSLDNVPCWGGQLISEGCNRAFNPATGLYTGQDLSGTQMLRAAEWQGNVGFVYAIPIGNSGHVLEFSNNNAYVGDHPVFFGLGRPDNDQIHKGYWKVDLGATYRTEQLELALIGKNISDKLSGSFCGAGNPQNHSSIFGGTVTGGTTRGSAQWTGRNCYIDPGREIWLRLTYKPRF